MTAFVVLSVAMPAMVGGVSAQEQTQENDTFVVKQGEQCVTITPISGNESVKTFYDYRMPSNVDPDNPYRNASGWSYSSEGPVELQQPNSSTLFLYEGANGTLSLVFLHGSVEGPSEGGSASFTVTGLQGGEWAVKDDEYDNGHNYDNWTHGEEYDRIDWTWDTNRTDGGAYAGLGDGFTVAIQSAFNENATLYRQHYTGTVDEFTALSGDRDDPEQIQLTRNEPVVVSDATCDELEGVTTDGSGDARTDTGTETGFTDTPGEPADAESRQRILEYQAADNSGEMDVSFTVEGTVDYGEEAEPSRDRIEENDDGTVTATSPDLNPNGRESWVVNGRIVEFSVAGGDLETIRIDGEETSVAELLSGETSG